jgi:hypothetical protein
MGKFLKKKDKEQAKNTITNVMEDSNNIAESETKDVEKKHPIKEFFSNFNFKNLDNKIKKYNYRISKIEVLQIFALLAVLTIIVGILFSLDTPYIVIMTILSMAFVPTFILNHYHHKFEQQRFTDVNVYIEQMLYSFSQTKVISASLQDVRTQFKDSVMSSVINNAIDCVNESNDVEKALDIIYQAYPADKVQIVHKFLLSAEKIGGNFNKTIDLLNQDRAAWERRKNKKEQNKNHMKSMVLTAIFISLIICMIFIHALPTEMTIAKNPIVETTTILLWFVDLICYQLADAKCAKGVLEEKTIFKKSDSVRRYRRVIDYDEHLETKTSFKLAIIPLILTIVAFIRQSMLYGCLFLGVTVFMLYQHKIGYNTTKKSATKEIEATFPQWMMEVALLLQTNSVKSALYHSIPNAPEILKEELAKFYEAVNQNPHSIDPYINFMHDFDVPQITSAMKMLYAISEGEGGDSDSQIAEIIRKNNEMLDHAEEIADEDSLASMNALYLAPSLLGGSKLLVDMVIFLLSSLTVMM